MVKKVELLVHAGAPSNRKDDDKYKAQAEAYLAFEGSVVKLPRETSHRELNVPVEEIPGNPSSDIADHDVTITGQYDPTMFLDDTQLALAALDSQLVTSSLPVPAEPGSVIPDHGFTQELSASQNASVESNIGRKADGSTQRSILREPHSDQSTRKRKLQPDSPDAREHDSRDATAHNEPPNVLNAHERPQNWTGLSSSTPSSYLRTPIIDRPKKKAKAINQHNQSDDLGQRAPVPHVPFHEDGRIGLAYIGIHPLPSTEIPGREHAQDSLGSMDGAQTTSELPTSYSLSDISSDSSKSKLGISQRSTSDPGPGSDGISPTALGDVRLQRKLDLEENSATSKPVKGANEPHSVNKPPELAIQPNRQDPTSSKLRRTVVQRDCTIAGPSVQHSEDLRGQRPENLVEQEQAGQRRLPGPSKQVLNALANLSTSIRPPEPITSLGTFTTHVTEDLRVLADDLDIKERYKPVSVSRELRPLERGHWLIKFPLDSDCWPTEKPQNEPQQKCSLEQQLETWNFLKVLISRGSAGWGVWCTRNDGEDQSTRAQASIGIVKVFCWGEVVDYIYIMLYVASKSKVRRLGLQWVDGEGQVVVQMRE